MQTIVAFQGKNTSSKPCLNTINSICKEHCSPLHFFSWLTAPLFLSSYFLIKHFAHIQGNNYPKNYFGEIKKKILIEPTATNFVHYSSLKEKGQYLFLTVDVGSALMGDLTASRSYKLVVKTLYFVHHCGNPWLLAMIWFQEKRLVLRLAWEKLSSQTSDLKLLFLSSVNKYFFEIMG